MELFLVIALSANVVLTGTCAYCLAIAVLRNSHEESTKFLLKAAKITRKLVIIGGSILMAFCIWSAALLVAGPYSASIAHLLHGTPEHH